MHIQSMFGSGHRLWTTLQTVCVRPVRHSSPTREKHSLDSLSSTDCLLHDLVWPRPKVTCCPTTKGHNYSVAAERSTTKKKPPFGYFPRQLHSPCMRICMENVSIFEVWRGRKEHKPDEAHACRMECDLCGCFLGCTLFQYSLPTPDIGACCPCTPHAVVCRLAPVT